MTTTDTQFQAEPAVYNETRALLDFFLKKIHILKKEPVLAKYNIITVNNKTLFSKYEDYLISYVLLSGNV